MAVRILELKQNSPEWLEARRSHVTGSNADILLTRGLDAALRANSNSFNGNFFTKRGHILEDEAIELYEAIHECIVARPGFVINDRWPSAGCSPDGIDDIILIEVKAFAERKHLEIMDEASIPFKIMAQLQWNMMITELGIARLVLYNPDIADNDLAYREIEVAANPKVQTYMLRKIGHEV
jgi:hypothetical protein